MQRLARSRQAITDQLRRRDGRDEPAHSPRGVHESREGGWWASTREALGTWWKYHPAHAALDLATPALSRYAHDKPVQMVAIAVGVGIVAAVVRPWRLVSVTGIALALLKSSQLPTMLLSLLVQDRGGMGPPS